MNKYQCKKCNNEYSSLQALNRHENKKFKCDITTKYQCKICRKSFKYNKNLQEHIEKTSCNILNNENNINKALFDIINNDISLDDKIFFIKNINNTITNDEITKIINSKFDITTKITLLNTKKGQPNSIINNTTNNTTNNIQFNNFGNENIEYFNENYLKKLINTVNSANKVGAQSVFLKLSNEIYLNEKHPENQTIKIDNLNNKFCKIKQNNKWITADKNESLKKIFNRACEIVSMCIMENKDMYKEAQLETINGYIEKDFDDDIVIETVKKLALDIYNFYNSTVV